MPSKDIPEFKRLKRGVLGVILAGAAALIANEYLTYTKPLEVTAATEWPAELAVPDTAAPSPPGQAFAAATNPLQSEIVALPGGKSPGRPTRHAAHRPVADPGPATDPVTDLAAGVAAAPVVARLHEAAGDPAPIPVEVRLPAAAQQGEGLSQVQPTTQAQVPTQTPAQMPAPGSVAVPAQMASPAAPLPGPTLRSRAAAVCGWDPRNPQGAVMLPPFALLVAACALPYELDDRMQASRSRRTL